MKDGVPSETYGWEGAVNELSQLKKDIEQGWITFWSKDQIIGFDDKGKRIGTGIPRKLSKQEFRFFSYSPRSKALPSLKSKESNDRPDG